MAPKMSVKARQRKRTFVAPVRLPGLKFEAYEGDIENVDIVHGTDRAPTYQSQFFAKHPRQYLKRIIGWIRGRSTRVYRPVRKRAASSRRRVAAVRARVHAKRLRGRGVRERHVAH